MKAYMSKTEAAEYLGISRKTFNKYFDHLPCKRLGSKKLYKTTVLDDAMIQSDKKTEIKYQNLLKKVL